MQMLTINKGILVNHIFRYFEHKWNPQAKVIMHKTFSYAPFINTSQPSDLVHTCNNHRLLSSHSHNLIAHTIIRDSTLLAAPTCSPLLAAPTWFIRLGHGDVIAM